MGVYYGAGASEADLCAHEDVYIVGGGNSAGQAAMHFSSRTRKVFILIRGDGLKQTVSQYLIDRILAAPNVELWPQTEVTELHGDRVLEAITITNQTSEQKVVKTCWLFLAWRCTQHRLGWRGRYRAGRAKLPGGGG
jgi:thioredoxin reductase (NADPH)